jgi:hypothetical protein
MGLCWWNRSERQGRHREQELNGRHPQGDVGLLLLPTLDLLPAVGAGQGLPLELREMKADSAGFENLQIGAKAGDRSGVAPMEEMRDRGHSRRHGDVPGKENPTGRDPWGPGEARRTARGGIRERSRAWSAKSSDTSEASQIPPQSSDRIELPFMASSPWSGRVCASGTNLARGNGRFHGRT